MKDHCYYCDKALYRMYVQKGIYSHVDDTERFENSDKIRICIKCFNRLIPRDTALNCPSCDKPVFALRADHFREVAIRRKHLKGIAPQPDPYPNAFIKCRHCTKEITAWE